MEAAISPDVPEPMPGMTVPRAGAHSRGSHRVGES